MSPNAVNPEETNLALLTQPLERRDHVVEHLPDAQRRSAAFLGNRIVQMKDVDPVKTQPRQTAFERCPDRVGNAAGLAGRQPNLGADDCVGRLQFLQDTAEVLFRFTIAVLHGGVEIVDADVNRPRDGALLLGNALAAHHESTDGAAAKTQHRKLHSGAPQSSATAWLLLRLAGEIMQGGTAVTQPRCLRVE